ncbi:MAG TPA: hypothetical protein VLB07_09555 [Woeseiaceae bacterium]|nr:hypothetical protein [Woeseiaceae bacterium]
MDSHKDKQLARADELPTQTDSALHDNVRITRSKLVFDELSIVDDDRGSDPYNSTGAHCILKARDIADN